MKVQFTRLDSDAQVPTYATLGAAGVDLRAMLHDPLYLHPGEAKIIGTGIAIHIGDPTYCGKLYPRSGLGSKHGIVLGNGTGILDSDYQGEIKVCLWNRSDNGYEIEPGERIAQLVITPVMQVEFEEVNAFEASKRGAEGFGSTGK